MDGKGIVGGERPEERLSVRGIARETRISKSRCQLALDRIHVLGVVVRYTGGAKEGDRYATNRYQLGPQARAGECAWWPNVIADLSDEDRAWAERTFRRHANAGTSVPASVPASVPLHGTERPERPGRQERNHPYPTFPASGEGAPGDARNQSRDQLIADQVDLAEAYLLRCGGRSSRKIRRRLRDDFRGGWTVDEVRESVVVTAKRQLQDRGLWNWGNERPIGVENEWPPPVDQPPAVEATAPLQLVASAAGTRARP